jgi:hypothetical protein
MSGCSLTDRVPSPRQARERDKFTAGGLVKRKAQGSLTTTTCSWAFLVPKGVETLDALEL